LGPAGLAHDAQRRPDAERHRGDPPFPAGTLTLVVDASVAIPACLGTTGFAEIPDADLVAPPLLWSETRSVLHELVWRTEIPPSDGVRARGLLDDLPVRAVVDDRVGARSWQIADELGWAKTYDAEYLALAQLLGCRLVTSDARLWRGAKRLGIVVSMEELLG